MSYHNRNKLARYRSHGQPVPIGGFWDALVGGGGGLTSALLPASCPPSDATNQFQARISELESTWHPTGFYAWNEMADVVAAVVSLAGAASSAAISFFSGDSLPSAKDTVRKASDRYNEVAKQAIDYTLAWKAAKAANKPVEAPGFKRWVIDDLKAAADLYRVVEVQACNQPWWLGVAASYGRFFNAVIEIAKRVGRIVLKAGESALKAAERTGDIVSFLLEWGPYLALGIGGFFLYSKFVKK